MALAFAQPSEAAQRISDRLLDRDIDWTLFARLSLRHALAPLMHSHLANDGRVPENILAGLSSVARANGIHTLRLAGELVQLTKAFADADVPVISVKGPALGLLVDGQLGQRMIGDLDLLIPPERAQDAIAIIVKRGFTHSRNFALNGVDDGLLRASDHMYIELHRRLGMPWLPFHLPLADMFNKVEPVRLGNDDVPVLPLEENLLYLCYHGAKHGWSRLAWLTGFVGLLQKEADRVNPERLAERCEDLHLQIAMGSALLIARDYLHIKTIPAPLIRHLDSPEVVRFSELCLADSFAERPPASSDLDGGDLLKIFAYRKSPALEPCSPALKRIHADRGRDALLRLPKKSRNLHARKIYAALGGNIWQYTFRVVFAPSQAHVDRYGVSANNRLFYAILVPIENAVKTVRMMARKAVKMASRTQ